MSLPTAAERLRPGRGREDPRLAWGGALVLAGLAFVLRWWHLDQPDAFSFDETYYAKDAWSLLHHGHVLEYVDKADRAILAGHPDGLWKHDPSMVVHPEVGKWLIALGIKAFGMDPFGWRIASVVAGSLMVLVMCRFVRRVTGSATLGLLGGFLLSLDGLQLVLSRLALLDIFMALFLLCAVHAVVADRQWLRERLAAGATRALWRPWLLVGGVCFGLAIGTKWTAIFPLAAFGLLSWAWSSGARRTTGTRWAWLRSALVDGVPAFLHLVVVALVVYVASWTGWLVHAQEYEDTLSDTQYATYDGGTPWPTAAEPDATGVGEVGQSLRSLARYHHDVYVFHTHFLDDSSHSYASHPLGWLLQSRPVGVDAQLDIKPGEQGCDAPKGSDCLRQVLLLGNPVLWWAGCLALLLAVPMWLGARDWRFGVAVVGTASTWLPWTLNADRPIFLFYAVASLPFVVLATTLAMGWMIGTDDRPTARRTAGVVGAGVVLVLVVITFAWFWPIWTDQLITHDEWAQRIWFSEWI